MSRMARERKRRGGNLFTTLLGASLLITMGFALGLIAGALWEERELVAVFLLGESEEVAVIAMEGDAPLESELALDSTPLGIGAGQEREAEETPAPAQVAERPPSAKAKMKPPAVSMAPPAGSFEIQVGAYSVGTAAEELARDLRSKGFSVNIAHQAPGKGKAERWRVRVGPIETRAEAEFLASRLKREEKLPTWILGGQDG